MGRRRATQFGVRTYDLMVCARTLNRVLSESGVTHIDFSLDVEGFEAMVLRGLDLDLFAPEMMLIEVVAEGSDHRREILDMNGDRYETSVDTVFQRIKRWTDEGEAGESAFGPSRGKAGATRTLIPARAAGELEYPSGRDAPVRGRT